MGTGTRSTRDPGQGYGRHRIRRLVGGLTVTITRHADRLRTPAHAHPWACLHYVLDGVYREAVRGASRSLVAGELLFKPPDECHWNELEGGGSLTLRLEISASRLEQARGVPERSVTLDDPALGALAERLAFAAAFPDHDSGTDTELLATELIDDLTGRGSSPDRRCAAALARQCVELIEEHDPEPIGLNEAAAALGVHRAHLARVFRQGTGTTLGEYQRLRRLRRTLQALRSGTSRGLAELAADAGYSDQSHLTRSVRAAAGLPPGALRSLWNARGLNAASRVEPARLALRRAQRPPSPARSCVVARGALKDRTATPPRPGRGGPRSPARPRTPGASPGARRGRR